LTTSLHVSGDFVKGSDEIYRCAALQEFAWLAHGFTTRRSSESAPPLTTLRQIHSATVWNAAGLKDRDLEGDALVSNEEGKWVGVRTADCVPILLAGVRTRAVAAIHAGWRGTAHAIARRAVERLVSDFGAEPDEIFAAIGPSIGVCCYQVGPEVRSRFEDLFPEWDSVSGRNEPGMLNLTEANRRILQAAGVPDSQIFRSNLCTSHRSDDFFSYRREPAHPGRMISFIARQS
jgi:YfiH family protein